MVGACRDDARTGAELLAAFAETHDEIAFTALVARHGRRVWVRCASILGEAGKSNVDDCFQAVFIALARKVCSVKGVSLPFWLAETARRSALEARRNDIRRQVRQYELAERLERPRLVESQADFDAEAAEVLKQELDSLPEKLRTPVVLFYLEGRTQAQVAAFLGCDQSVVSRRLNKALNFLRKRLDSRGVVITSTTLAGWFGYLATTEASMLPRSGAIDAAARAAIAAVSGVKGAASPAAVALAAAALRPRISLVWLLAGGMVALGGMGLALLAGAGRSLDSGNSYVANATNEQAEPDKLPRPTVEISGQIIGPDGRPVADADVSILSRRPWTPGLRADLDTVVARGQADAVGRYHLTVPSSVQLRNQAVLLTTNAPGLAPEVTPIAFRDSWLQQNVRMAPASTAIGRVSGPDGRPAAAVRLSVVRMGRLSCVPTQGDVPVRKPPGWPADVVTAADGSFRIESVPPDTDLWVQAQDERYALGTFYMRFGKAAGPFKLSRAKQLSGTVVAEAAGEPLAGARISVFAGPREAFEPGYSDPATALENNPEKSWYGKLSELSAVADARGHYRVALPPGAVYRVFAYPPCGSAYLGRTVTVDWPDEAPARDLTVSLPEGTVVRGLVRDDDGSAIEGARVALVTAPPAVEPRLLLLHSVAYWDDLVFTNANGEFQIAVPRGPARLQVFGPSPRYRYVSQEVNLAPAADNRAGWEHGKAELKRRDSSPGKTMQVVLREGDPLRVRVVDPEGKPVSLATAARRSLPLPPPSISPFPFLVKDGEVELPECVPGRTYSVLIFDRKGRIGAAADVKATNPGEPPPTVRLERYGNARVRLLNASGRPVSGCRAYVSMWFGAARPTSLQASTDSLRADPFLPAWLEEVYCLYGPTTDADGCVTLPAVLAGAEYGVSFVLADGREFHSQRFRASPGQTVHISVTLSAAEHRAAALPMNLGLLNVK
jgi:RNA polymerase sigma factor (sigma-70 family)